MTELAEAMLTLVKRNDYVSMAELEEVCRKQGVEPKGDRAITCFQEEANIWIWFNMSEAFCDAINEIRPFVDPSVAHPLVYLIDGAYPSVPIAKRIPKKGYKEPRWIPVTFRMKQVA